MLARLLCCLLVALTAGLTGTTPAHADDPPVRVELTSVTPSAIASTGDLVISGEVTNTTPEPLTDAQVRLWRARGAITNLDALANARNSAPGDPAGGTSKDPRATFDLTFNQTSPLAAGETRAFTVTASFADGNDPLRLTSLGAAYLVGVVVQTGTGTPQVLGRARTLLPSPNPRSIVQVGTVVVLNSRPSMLAAASSNSATPASFVDGQLGLELAGRLGTLLTLAEKPGVSTVIDPALYDEVTAMAPGYLVDGQPGASPAVARSWLARVDALIVAGGVYRSLYGSPDVSRALAGNLPGIVTQAVNVMTDGHSLSALPLAIIPTPGTTTAALVDFLRPAKPAVILADTVGSSRLVQTDRGMTLLAVSPDGFSPGPGPEPRDTPVQITGHRDSLQVLSWLQNVPVVSVISTTTQAQVELQDANWRTGVRLETLLNSTTSNRTTFADTAEQADPPDPAWVARVDTLAANMVVLGDLTGRLKQATLDSSRVVSRAWSQAFSADPVAGGRWLDAVEAPVAATVGSGAIELHLAPNWVLSSESNELPITVRNGLNVLIKVRVEFTSENPQRVEIAPTPLLSVGPGESVTQKVVPQAHSNGKVELHAQIVTERGARLGEPSSILVTATSAGRVGWIIIVGAGAVLLFGTALRVRQVRRIRAAEAVIADAEAEPTPALLPEREHRKDLPDHVTDDPVAPNPHIHPTVNSADPAVQ